MLNARTRGRRWARLLVCLFARPAEAEAITRSDNPPAQHLIILAFASPL